MSLRRSVFRSCNAVLSHFNLALQVITQDFDARLDQPSQVSRIFSAFAKIADEWLRGQNLFTMAGKFDSTQALRQFYEQFLDSPFRGMGEEVASTTSHGCI